MLTLGRESGEYVVIGGNIVVQVVKVNGQVRLAIDAPKEVIIERGEIYESAHPAPTSIRAVREKLTRSKS